MILPVFLLAFIASFTRIYLGVHYPTDVLGGAICGIIFGVLAYKLFLYASAPRGLQPPGIKHARPYPENPDHQVELTRGCDPQSSSLEDPP